MKQRVTDYRQWGSINGSLAVNLAGRVQEQHQEYSYQNQTKATVTAIGLRRHKQAIGKELGQITSINSLLLSHHKDLGSKLQEHGYSKGDAFLIQKCLVHYKYYKVCLNAFDSNIDIEAGNYGYYNYCQGKIAAYENIIMSLLHKKHQ